MLVRRFYDDRLAQASYLIGCQRTGEAIVIDPARDVAQYLEAETQEGVGTTRVTARKSALRCVSLSHMMRTADCAAAARYWATSRAGASTMARNGMSAPTRKDSAEAPAACSGRARR